MIIGVYIAIADAPPVKKPLRNPVKVTYRLLGPVIKSGYLEAIPNPSKLSTVTTSRLTVINIVKVRMLVRLIIAKTPMTAIVAAEDMDHVGNSFPFMSVLVEMGNMQRLVMAFPSCPILIVESHVGTRNGMSIIMK